MACSAAMPGETLESLLAALAVRFEGASSSELSTSWVHGFAELSTSLVLGPNDFLQGPQLSADLSYRPLVRALLQRSAIRMQDV